MCVSKNKGYYFSTRELIQKKRVVFLKLCLHALKYKKLYIKLCLQCIKIQKTIHYTIFKISFRQGLLVTKVYEYFNKLLVFGCKFDIIRINFCCCFGLEVWYYVMIFVVLLILWFNVLNFSTDYNSDFTYCNKRQAN